jgi:N-acetylglucosamine-6-phosphate deacetylase
MGMVGIESEADRIGVTVILESLHVQSNSVPGWRCTVKESQIAQVLDNLNQKGAESAPWFADLDVFRSQAER